MLERAIAPKICDWIKAGKNALLIDGARQVGKTFLIRQCLQDMNCDYLEINLIRTPELVPVLASSSTSRDLITNLSAYSNHTLKPGETFLFIDEIQEYKEIVTQIKFWVDDGSFRFILSGSLLGIELVNLHSAPVGYLDELVMYPLSFEEFLYASGILPEVIEALRTGFEERKPVPEYIHEKMLEQFRRYLVVGGMPAVVDEYMQSGDINAVMRIQRNIIAQYKRDFTKYESQTKRLMLIDLYDEIPAQLLKQNRRFCLADIKKGLRFERVEDSFLWFEKAGVVIAVYNATEPRISLSQNEKSTLLKLYLNDVGLLTCQYGKAAKAKLLINDTHLNRGGIYENAVAQELYAHGYRQYYYNSKKRGELDFVIEYEGQVLPIEVKSGKDYHIHSAINNVIDTAEYDITEAIVLADCNVQRQGKITYLPVYMCMFINDDYDLPVLDPISWERANS